MSVLPAPVENVETQSPPEQSRPRPRASLPEPARILLLDISGPARALSVLRWSEFILVVGGLATLPGLVLDAIGSDPGTAAVRLGTAALLGLSAYTAWRHVGVIDARVWRAYAWVYPLLLAMSVVTLLATSTGLAQAGWQQLGDFPTLITLFTQLSYVAIALPGLWCVHWLLRARLGVDGAGLAQLLAALQAQAGSVAPTLPRVPPANRARGVACALLGVLLLAALQFAPMMTDSGAPSAWSRLSQPLVALACFLLIWARRHFQVSADALLAVDQRPPILFLRSFADDERQHFGNARQALLDFSLETRLGGHFQRFGPFIAIGAPGEGVPVPGAARVQLRDDEWQARVLGWMREARLIIMYAGNTEWVSWELSRVLEAGRAPSLILMFPELKALRRARRQRDIRERAERLRAIFRDTPWNEELQAFDAFEDLRAMLFRPDGSMLMLKSRSRRRDAYHLAALLAHQALLDPPRGEGSLALSAGFGPWQKLGAAALVALLLVTGFAGKPASQPETPPLETSQPAERLSFGNVRLYRFEPVSAAEASAVGQVLVELGVFGEQGVQVRLAREQGLTELGFVINPEHAGDPDVLPAFAEVARVVSAQALGAQPLTLRLYDEAGHELAAQRIEPDPAGSPE